MLSKGRVTAPALVTLSLVASLVVTGCASQSGTGVSTAGSGPGGPAVELTGATLVSDGEAPRLLLSGSAPLSPTVFTRDDGRRVVVDLSDTVVAAGLEPPRPARGTTGVISKVTMSSFTELGKPHVQLELVGSVPFAPRVEAGVSASGALAVVFDRKASPAPEASALAAAAPRPEPVQPAFEPSVSAPPAAADAGAARPAAAPAAVAEGSLPEKQYFVQQPASGPSASRLQAVNARRTGSDTVVQLAGNGEFGYEAFLLANPPRWVVDLPGVKIGGVPKSQEVRGGPVTRVRVSQFRNDPAAVTRVVFDLADGVVPELRQGRTGLTVAFRQSTASAPAPMTAKAAPAAPKPDAVVASAAAPAAVPAAGSYEAHEAEDPAEKVVPPAPVVPVVAAAPPEARTADASPEPPAEPVTVAVRPVEPATAAAPPAETLEAAARPAEPVTVAAPPVQPEPPAPRPAEPTAVASRPAEAAPVASRPAEAAPAASRPVEAAPVASRPAEPTAVASRAVEPPIEVMTVTASAAEAEKPAAAPAAQVAEAPAAPPAAAAPVAPASAVAEKAPTPAPAPVPAKQPPAQVAAAPAAPRPAAAPAPARMEPSAVQASAEVPVVERKDPKPAAPVAEAKPPVPPRRAKSPTASRALVEAAEALLLQQDSTGPTKDLGNPYEARVMGSTEKQYTGEPITLNLKDADVKDTLQKFSELTGLNIVLDPDVRGTVTVSLTDIPWDQALELILKINGLGYTLEGNVMRIATTGKLANEETQKRSLLTAQEQNRPVKTIIQKLSYAQGGRMVEAIKKVMTPRGDVYVDQASNNLIIKELPENIPVILDLIRNLDVAPQQVMIEARIVEATRTFAKQLGVSWSFNGVADAAHGNTTGLVFPNNMAVGGQVSLPSGSNLLNLSMGNVLNTFNLDFALSAAENRGLVKVISSPKIVTTQLITASIQSGYQIPVQTTVNNTTSVLYIDATTRLDVIPFITAEGTILMNITIQRREPAVGINIAQGQNVPLVTRDAKTTVLVRDGGTAVIGGIMKLTANSQKNMIPGLWQIPILGSLFRNNSDSEENDELMIFITPRIVKNT